jgi:hypothetical protein
MYGDLLPWAGMTRTADHGPNGKVWVPCREVRVELRKLADDIRVRVDAMAARAGCWMRTSFG